MRRSVAAAVMLLVCSAPAHAQLGDWLKKIDPTKAKNALKVARDATREFTDEEEEEIGQIIAARILETYPLAANDRLQQYVTLVGNTVAAYSTRPTMEWHFAAIDSDVVNAFSTPGGYIFITTGALAQMHSEAELANVLGHEIAHTTQKHILKEIKRSSVIASSVDFAKSTSGSAWINDSMASRIGDVANEKLFKTGLSRRDELESDRIGDELAVRAGYRGSAFLTFLQTLQSLGTTTSALSQLSKTHPAPADRIAELKKSVHGDAGQLLNTRFVAWTASR